MKYALNHTADKSVIEGVKFGVEAAIFDLFPSLFENEKDGLLFPVKDIHSAAECDEWVTALSSYAAPFPRVTEKEIMKLFPKNKKLKLPDLTALHYDKMTYFSLIELSTNKLFMIYNLNGRIVGVECRFSVSNHHNVCAICNTPRSPEQVGFVTAVCKHARSGSPDYYKSIGNYMCLDSSECNKQIKDVSYLEKFMNEVLHNRE